MVRIIEAERIKKRWQKYIELYKRVLMTQITTMVWSLTWNQTSWSVKSSGSITTDKARGSGGIQAELFKILKDDAVKVLLSICRQI